jgi:acyl carrier protein
MKEKILEICRELCCKEVAEDEQLIASGLLDSFKIMELVCSLEEEFHITFLPEEISELDHFSSVNQMVELVREKTK